MEKENVMKWEDLRNQAAIAAMQGLLTNENYSSYMAREAKRQSEKPAEAFLEAISKDAVELANNLIEELRNSSADEVAGRKGGMG